MTEPHNPGSDPRSLTTHAVVEGDEFVINGHKWFSSNASVSDFLLVMAKTGDSDTSAYKAFSMFIVPTKTPGVNILRDVPTMGEPDHKTGEPGGHAEIIYTSSQYSGPERGVTVVGDYAFEDGTYSWTMKPKKGKEATEVGKYLTVWHKQADGSWKIARDRASSVQSYSGCHCTPTA
mgnify:CR=1 FL=1